MTVIRERELDTSAEVLERARELRVVADRAEADLLVLGAHWAAVHSSESVPDVDDGVWGERPLSLAGPGAPEVAEFCVAEFALSVGMSSDAGRRYLGEAVELAYRLPTVWARVEAGQLPAWRARRIARATVCLPVEGAAFVDRQVAMVAAKVGVPTLDRLVQEARVRFDPDEAEARAVGAAEARDVQVCLDQVGFEGMVDVRAVLDLPDALDLEHAIQAAAARLAELGCTDSLAVRRASALGLLARGQLALAQPDAGRRISLHVHASADPSSPLVRVEEIRSFVLIDRLAEWCTQPATQLDVTPVFDLADHLHVEAYEVPDRLATQTRLRDLTCVFPRCTRPAVRCDCDHIVPYARGGPTCSCNLAPLCRGHHRLKTHGGWSYTVLEPGTYHWSSPHGYAYLRDQHGTRDVTDPRSRSALSHGPPCRGPRQVSAPPPRVRGVDDR